MASLITAPPLVIRVDRAILPEYPEKMEKVVRPDLALLGPSEYDLEKVELWGIDEQKVGFLQMRSVYDCLEKTGDLPKCLGLADLLAMKQALDFRTFQDIFPVVGAVYGWRSVIEMRSFGKEYERDPDLYSCVHRHVPCLYIQHGELLFAWRPFTSDWERDHYYLRFSAKHLT